jgi:hypothetical protein
MTRGARARLGAALLAAAAVGAACSSDPTVVFTDIDAGPGCGENPACPAGFSCSNGVCLEPGAGGTGGNGGEGGNGPGGAGPEGSGGIGATGGSAGSGARSGSGGVSGGGPGPGGGKIRCGDQECSIGDNQVCCATESPLVPVTFECRASGGGCSVRYECDGDEDCPSGQCCGTRGSTGQWAAFVCQSSCPGGALHVGCRGAANCQSGNVCCGTRTGGVFDAYTDVECSQTCDGANQTVLCSSESECGQQSCSQSTILPEGFSYCG